MTAREGTVFVCSFIASILSFHLCLFNAFLVILTLAVLTSDLPHLSTEIDLMEEAERLRNSNKCRTCCHTSEPWTRQRALEFLTCARIWLTTGSRNRGQSSLNGTYATKPQPQHRYYRAMGYKSQDNLFIHKNKSEWFHKFVTMFEGGLLKIFFYDKQTNLVLTAETNIKYTHTLVTTGQ